MQSNFDFSINKYEDAVDQFDSLTDRLTSSVIDVDQSLTMLICLP